MPEPEAGKGSRALVALHAGLIGAFALAALLDAPAKGWAVFGVVVAYGASTLLAYRWTGGRGRGEQVATALGIATLYLGATVLAHFLIDVAGFSIAA